MSSNNLPGLQELLEKVLSDAGLQGISVASCELLAKIISEQTLNQIAPVTLQRFYGLKVSLDIPSAYTLETLSKFCGFTGWEDWCRHLSQLKDQMPPELRKYPDLNI